MGGSVDHGAFESQLRDTSAQLFGSGLRIGHWQGGKAEEPARIGFRGGGKLVVRTPGQLHGLRRGQQLGGGRVIRQDLHVDTVLIHAGDSSGADIRQLLRLHGLSRTKIPNKRPGMPGRNFLDLIARGGSDLVIQEVLFYSDDLHSFVIVFHFAFPLRGSANHPAKSRASS
ncbi:hypothetical protein D3C81_1731800 [compost metagenome]